jgi:hypothetical protein
MAVVARRVWPEFPPPSLPLRSRAPASPPPRDARARFLGRHHGLRQPATVRQRRHPAMHTGELNVELG